MGAGGYLMRLTREEFDQLCPSQTTYEDYVAYFERALPSAPDPTGREPIDWLALSAEIAREFQ